jgi:hypothetical protein
MATKVRFAIPEREIEQSGVTFKRDTDAGRHGELTVRQNHVLWRPKKYEHVFRLTWEQLGNLAEEHGKKIRPKMSVVRAKKKLKS